MGGVCQSELADKPNETHYADFELYHFHLYRSFTPLITPLESCEYGFATITLTTTINTSVVSTITGYGYVWNIPVEWRAADLTTPSPKPKPTSSLAATTSTSAPPDAGAASPSGLSRPAVTGISATLSVLACLALAFLLARLLLLRRRRRRALDSEGSSAVEAGKGVANTSSSDKLASGAPPPPLDRPDPTAAELAATTTAHLADQPQELDIAPLPPASENKPTAAASASSPRDVGGASDGAGRPPPRDGDDDGGGIMPHVPEVPGHGFFAPLGSGDGAAPGVAEPADISPVALPGSPTAASSSSKLPPPEQEEWAAAMASLIAAAAAAKKPSATAPPLQRKAVPSRAASAPAPVKDRSRDVASLDEEPRPPVPPPPQVLAPKVPSQVPAQAPTVAVTAPPAAMPSAANAGEAGKGVSDEASRAGGKKAATVLTAESSSSSSSSRPNLAELQELEALKQEHARLQQRRQRLEELEKIEQEEATIKQRIERLSTRFDR